ncbi:glycosyltransferase [Silanimonas sp.]|uniref:glycosyltransferase family 2 protein n=1 Tax=Silanimonas sp. TaxID=1929290 RepID=UPI001BC734DB|nr:glycosyltransferase [Silanimonas sp.]MBS3896173.1 glycosyltransferase [Silanimonas sp.]MBS3924070.1 glycosyltransferase [Xanthomonadaceae bacterium]
MSAPSTLPVVVVPVFNALEALDACLAALDRSLPPGTRVHLADDASTDPRVPDLLKAWIGRTRLDAHLVRRARNLGFPGNCNAAFAETGPADLVLLNTDTVPAGDWLQRLRACAASDARIASATPWSNNGEIVSFPRFVAPNPLPDEPWRLAKAAARLTPRYPVLPTAVGFCMFLRRAALEALGGFDAATFGRGYGEENDWCLRTEAHGWRHVLCDDAYVAHLGHASFAALGEAPGGENLRRLNARWPGYNERIARFILDDPLREDRARLAEALSAAPDEALQGDLFR